jgi:hypothetical protein
MAAALKRAGLCADHCSKRSVGRTGDTCCASIPANTTMIARHDESSAEHSGKVVTFQREEIPEVKSFPKTDGIGKPLGAFEALPSHAVAPVTWSSHNS